jgi:hypothetical protein
MICTVTLQGFETYSQFSFRNLCLVSLDWVSVVIARNVLVHHNAASQCHVVLL